jgi:hypothetical protein
MYDTAMWCLATETFGLREESSVLFQTFFLLNICSNVSKRASQVIYDSYIANFN